MPNSVTNVGFTDYNAEQEAINRRMQMAQALQAQGTAPIEMPQTAPGGFTPHVSVFQGLGKMAQAYVGALGMKKGEEAQKNLASRYQMELADVLRRGSQAQAGTPAQTIQPDPQEAQQSADYGTPEVQPAQVPARAPDLGEAASIYMSHPATQALGMQLTQQQAQRQTMMNALKQVPPSGHPMVPGPYASVMAGSGDVIPQGSPQGPSFGAPAGGTPMEVWLQIDPTGKAYAEALAKEQMSPYQRAQLDQGERHFTGVSGNKQAELKQAAQLHGEITPYQRQELRLRALTIDPFGTLGAANSIPGSPLNVPSQQGGQPLNVPGAQPQPVRAAGQGMHGDDYLKTLPANVAAQVKALAEGRMDFPKGYALRSPQMQQLIQMVSQYDPSFDAVNYGARAKTRADFTSGTSSKQINAMNTVMGHLQSLSDAADRLNNTSMPGYNKITNWLSQATGDPRVQEFNATKKAVVDELTRVWRGNGGSEGDIKTWSEQINAAGSPAQLHGVIGQIGELVESKINAMGEQYKQGMGTTNVPIQLITPQSQKVLELLKKRGAQSASEDRRSEPRTGKTVVVNY